MRWLPFLAFFLSGASGLVFQTIWSRLLHHVFGSSSVAVSSVVSAFMAGLALGAWLFGRLSDRIRSPLLVYALAEAGVGIAGLLVPLLVDSQGFLADVNSWLRLQFAPDSGAFMLARFACIFPILVVPTTLMGATLPLLCRHFVAHGDDQRATSQRVGQLYAINTVGAVIGVFLAGFVLMPRLGVATTNALAACTNFALAVAIFALRRSPAMQLASGTHATTSQAGEALSGGSEERSWPARVRWAAALAFAASGAVALLSEVVWARALVNTVGASVYAFSLILMTFLIGIAGGSASAASVLATGQRVPLAGIAAAAVTLCLIACAPTWVHGGTWVFVGLVAVGGLLVGARTWLRTREVAAARAVDPEISDQDLNAMPAAWHCLAIPFVLASLVAIAYGDRLAGMASTVVALGCTLLLLLLHGRNRPVLLLAGLQGFIGVATFASDLWADELSIAFASAVAPLYDDLPNHVATVMALMSMTAGLCVLPSALGMGAMFPITIRIWSRGGRHVGRDVGVVYTGNTVGSILGAWLPGFVLMPVLGMQGTLHIGICLNLLLAAGVLLAAADRGASRARRALTYSVVTAAPLLSAALIWAAQQGVPALTWNISKMTLGAFRISLARDVLDEEAWGGPELVYHRDGISTTVTVERWGRHYSLKNNGKVDASNGDDMPTQIMVTALPLLLHRAGPTNLDVAIVGFGSGVTVGAALQFPVRSVETMELELAVVDASRFFADVNHLTYDLDGFPFARADRLSVYNDDGRNYLAASHRRYDVIVSEPSNPWLTGVSDLFTREHFEVSRDKLKPDGVYCQWVQLYELSPENVKVIYRTFATHFKHVIVFSAEDLSSDTILVGSDSPLTLDYRRLERTFADPRVSAELERAYVHVPQDVFARVLFANREEVMRYTHVEERLDGQRWRAVPAADNTAACPPDRCRRTPSPINTDDNAHIEFAAPRDLIGFERYKGYLRSMYAPEWPYGNFVEQLTGIGTGPAGARRLAQQAVSLVAHGRKRSAHATLARAQQLGQSPSLTRARALLHGLEAELPEAPVTDVSASVRGLGDALSRRLHAALDEVRRALARDDFEGAFEALATVPALVREQAGVDYVYADLAHRAGHHGKAIDTLEALVRRDPAVVVAHPGLHLLLARAHDALDHFDKAVRNMRAYQDTRAALARTTSAAPPKPPAGDRDATANTTDMPPKSPSASDREGTPDKAFR